MLRNLLLHANVAVTENDYEQIDREDRIYEAGVSARYLMNRNLYATVGYQHRQRKRDAASSTDYKQNVVTVRLELQM